jgi:hypothetical protein
MRRVLLASLLTALGCREVVVRPAPPPDPPPAEAFTTAEEAWAAFEAAKEDPQNIGVALEALAFFMEMKPSACDDVAVADAAMAYAKHHCGTPETQAYCLRISTACTLKAGDPCPEGKATCSDTTTALFCQDGRFAAVQCGGEEGCTQEAGLVSCDYSGNQAGDACIAALEGQGDCGEDGLSIVTCTSGRFTVYPCRGPAGCTKDGTSSRCDGTRAQEGDPCQGNGLTCRFDGTAFLRCERGVAVLDDPCPAETACEVVEGTPKCLPR